MVLMSFLVWWSSAASVLAQQPSSPPAHASDRSLNTALGVDCSHCHRAESWTDRTLPAHATARRMFDMVDFLNRGPLADTSGVTCWSCHRGQRRPRRIPAEAWESVLNETFVGPLATVADDVKLTMAVYSASLGVPCVHCHEAGQWAAATKPTHALTSRMNELIAELPKYLPQGARTQCFMCHQGSRRPAIGPAAARPPRH